MGTSSDGPADPPTVDESSPSAALRTATKLTLRGYDVGAAIGVGGMGEVLVAHDPRLDRDVAVKRMRDAEPRPDAVERFLREAKIQARLDHPAIVPVHEIGYDDDGRPYFTMKRLAGVTLAQRLATGGPIQPLLRALVDVCQAIDLAHARRVAHRDLKPSNIMLGEYGEVYVLDWGVARLLDEVDARAAGAERNASGTQVGAIIGTPGYIAPEQLRGEPNLTEAIDIYALGAILFEILAGEPLHLRDDAFESTLSRATDSPAARRPDRDVAPELDAVCVAALSEDPAQRPTARALAEQLQAYIDGDRDVEHRRELAARQIAVARTALADGRRSEAIAAAGRALALDPQSPEASRLVVSFIVAPPQTLPPELEAALDASENAVNRERSRRSVLPLAAIVICVLPMAVFTEVASWPDLIGLVVAVAMMETLAVVHWKTGWSSPPILFFTASVVLVLFFSRLAGPFVLTPVLVCALMLVLGTRSQIWTVPVFAATSALLPIALERIGVLGPTMQIPQDGWLMFGSSTFTNAAPAYLRLTGVIGGTFALLVIVGMFTTIISRQRQAAQRALQIQTWTLQQLLPSQPISTISRDGYIASGSGRSDSTSVQ